jgi:GDPmannose 4,6-dehydratase
MHKAGRKLAIITGVTGQDGSYLSELLLSREYHVVGVKRRTSTDNTWRIKKSLSHPYFLLIEGDVTDYSSVVDMFKRALEFCGDVKQDDIEFYNTAAQSHVHTSFNQPVATFNVDAIGVLNILEVIKNQYPLVKLYQCSTSEMFGCNCSINEQGKKIQNEDTPFNPVSPYAIAKLAAHQMVGLYRTAYDIFACCGILFNHTSPRRGDEFVTQKIAKYVGRLHRSGGVLSEKLQLGNLSAYRDFGYAPDYVNAMYMMLQHDVPDDYVIATNTAYSIRELCEYAFSCVGYDYKDWVVTSDDLHRPHEVPYLCGDATKAHKVLGWKPTIDFQQLIYIMVNKQC